jgi:hypothetical protein
VPIRITRSSAPEVLEPLDVAMLPEEIYVEMRFDDYDRAVAWCDSVESDLRRPVFNLGTLDRVVLWRADSHGS